MSLCSHSKNMHVRTNGIIRSIFMRLNDDDKVTSRSHEAFQAVTIRNVLNGASVLFSFEMAIGFTRLLKVTPTTVRVESY